MLSGNVNRHVAMFGFGMLQQA